jgi:hypothetical protein
MSGSQSPQMTAAQQNALARALIRAQSLEMLQVVNSGTIASPTSGNNVLNISPRNVGLLRGFVVQTAATITNSNTTTPLALTGLGPANMLSGIAFYDLNNNLRHNTTGWHVSLLDSIRKGYPYPAGVNNFSPVGFGNNWVNNIVAGGTIAASGSATIRNTYYIPITYTMDDLRGGIYMGVVNATANLQLTINPNPVIATGDATLGVYSGAAGTMTNFSYTVYQDYIDQLPVSQTGAPVLPLTDLSTVYELKTTTNSAINVSQDYPIAYPNFRSFLSTMAILDNGGTLAAGTDVNYWSLQAANFTNIWKMDPNLAALMTRDILYTDLPKGVYYFDHRRKPLATNQYGNLNLVLNASTINAGAQLLMGYEDFALINNVQGAGSFPGV